MTGFRFKFHYDSINSEMRAEAMTEFMNDLNSIMILLILRSINPPYTSSEIFKFHYDSINSLFAFGILKYANKFKFHYDSINSRWWRYQICSNLSFKFHYDSINSSFPFSVLMLSWLYLNSIMILLIRIIAALSRNLKLI